MFSIVEMADMVAARARNESLSNIEALLRDFISDGTGLTDNGVDYAMPFNIMHDERPERILNEAYRIVRPGGRIGIIHWNYDNSTPRGAADGDTAKAGTMNRMCS